MTARRIFIVWFSLAFGLPTTWAEERTCPSLSISGPPEYFPLSYADAGAIKGVGIDLALIAAEEAGILASVSYRGSWSRVLQQHALGNIDVIVGLYHTKPREETMLFLPAFWSEETQIVMRRDKPISFQIWDDLKTYRGVTISSDSRGDQFDAFMRSELNMLYVHSQEVAFNLLKAGRVDYMLTGQYSMFETADFGQDATLMLHPTPVSSHHIYMAFSRLSPCIGVTDRLSEALSKLVREGKVAPLFANHPMAAHAIKAD